MDLTGYTTTAVEHLVTDAQTALTQTAATAAQIITREGFAAARSLISRKTRKELQWQ